MAGGVDASSSLGEAITGPAVEEFDEPRPDLESVLWGKFAAAPAERELGFRSLGVLATSSSGVPGA